MHKMVCIEIWAWVLWGLAGIPMAITAWMAGYQTAKRKFREKKGD